MITCDIIIEYQEMKKVSEILEITMIICFGASWPMNVIKSFRARTAKGKSISFLCLIFIGYIAGVFSKITNEAYMQQLTHKWYVLFFYLLNLFMVGVDICLYVRNRRFDRKNGEE